MEKTFNSEKILLKEYGKVCAKKIKLRMSVLASAPNLAHIPTIPPERCHELKGGYKGMFAVDLKHPFRLIFKPINDPIPLKSDGGIDLSKVTSIEIQKVEDYHK